MRAQVSEEFMVIFAAMLLLFYIFYMLYASQLTSSYQANEKMVAMRVASEVRAAIDYVYLAGDGTAYSMTLRTNGMNVTINNGVVGVRSEFASYYLPLITARINTAVVNQGDIVIRNNKGVIEIA